MEVDRTYKLALHIVADFVLRKGGGRRVEWKRERKRKIVCVSKIAVNIYRRDISM